MHDAWAQGDAYEPYIGRWSRPVAADFVTWLDRPAGLRWVDLGCGTAALTSAVLAAADPLGVLGVDPSPAFVAWSRDHLDDPRATFREGLVPDAVAALRAMAAAARGGTIAG